VFLCVLSAKYISPDKLKNCKMPKRPYPDDDIVQPIKKQVNTKSKSRKIRSCSSERALQLLYEGAAKYENRCEHKKEPSKTKCSRCSTLVLSTTACSYCEHDTCLQCINVCYKCNSGFCSNCSFPTYDENEAVCYSCYV
jgi:hypothetical protein